MSDIDINHDCYCTICGASADALAADNERLRDDRDRLAGELAEAKSLEDYYHTNRDIMGQEWSKVKAERDALQAQVAGLQKHLDKTWLVVDDFRSAYMRLRGALETAIPTLDSVSRMLGDEARAALAGPTRTADQPEVVRNDAAAAWERENIARCMRDYYKGVLQKIADDARYSTPEHIVRLAREAIADSTVPTSAEGTEK